MKIIRGTWSGITTYLSAVTLSYINIHNQGYDGDLEVAMVPESFLTDVLKQVSDSNEVLVENASVEPAKFALMFEFDGDAKKIRHVLYNCSADRPSEEGKTISDKKEVQTESLSIQARPLANGYVKARTSDGTAAAAYSGWYDAVYLPSITAVTTTPSGGGETT